MQRVYCAQQHDCALLKQSQETFRVNAELWKAGMQTNVNRSGSNEMFAVILAHLVAKAGGVHVLANRTHRTHRKHHICRQGMLMDALRSSRAASNVVA